MDAEMRAEAPAAGTRADGDALVVGQLKKGRRKG